MLFVCGVRAFLPDSDDYTDEEVEEVLALARRLQRL